VLPVRVQRFRPVCGDVDREFVVPFHVALAAFASGAPLNIAQTTAMTIKYADTRTLFRRSRFIRRSLAVIG
jgi:hypothetical protein